MTFKTGRVIIITSDTVRFRIVSVATGKWDLQGMSVLRYMEAQRRSGAALAHSMYFTQINLLRRKREFQMRKKVTKVILSMALSLAVATSFMGSTARVSAEEGRQAACRGIEGHEMVDDGSWHDGYEEWNSEYHFYINHVRQKCKNCTLRISSDEREYEYHDMRGVSQAPFRAHCILCGYEE